MCGTGDGLGQGSALRFMSDITQVKEGETLETPAVTTEWRATRSMILKLVRARIPFKKLLLGNGITMFVRVPAAECTYLRWIQ